MSGPVPIGEFMVKYGQDEVSLLDVPLRNESIKRHATDPELAEYVVGVDWEWDVPANEGYWERGFFWRRGTTVVELRDPTTARKICAHAGIPMDERAGAEAQATGRTAATPS
jgi:hypothetical protein